MARRAEEAALKRARDATLNQRFAKREAEAEATIAAYGGRPGTSIRATGGGGIQRRASTSDAEEAAVFWGGSWIPVSIRSSWRRATPGKRTLAVAWFPAWILAIRSEWGSVFFILSVIAGLFACGTSSERRSGPSGYSVFNEDCAPLLGSETAFLPTDLNKNR